MSCDSDRGSEVEESKTDLGELSAAIEEKDSRKISKGADSTSDNSSSMVDLVATPGTVLASSLGVSRQDLANNYTCSLPNVESPKLSDSEESEEEVEVLVSEKDSEVERQ